MKKLKRNLTLYPSKPFGLYAMMEWGLRDVKFLSPFSFSANTGDSTLTFHVSIQDHTEAHEVELPAIDEQYLILYIPNKRGDNCVVIDAKDCPSVDTFVEFKWVAKHLKRKFYVRGTTADIQHDG